MESPTSLLDDERLFPRDIEGSTPSTFATEVVGKPRMFPSLLSREGSLDVAIMELMAGDVGVCFKAAPAHLYGVTVPSLMIAALRVKLLMQLGI